VKGCHHSDTDRGAEARRPAGEALSHPDERGLTLIELLIAIVLLAVALTGLAASYPLAMQAVTDGGSRIAATLLAQQCIELAKSTPYDRLPIDLAPSCPVHPAGYAGFTRTLTVAPGVPTGTTTTVTVEVGYRGGPGSARTAVATILSQ
jgi:prepilin-type N-terminal cleavage/methylation domain-containing protein